MRLPSEIVRTRCPAPGFDTPRPDLDATEADGQARAGADPSRRTARRELVITVIALLSTIGTACWLAWSLAEAGAAELDHGWLRGSKAVLFGAAVGAVAYGGVVYLLARLGWVRRQRLHRPASPGEVDADVFGAPAERLVVLVPSYREDVAVVRQTLLSAALQDYPNRRVVLLLDDPPGEVDAASQTVRNLPAAIDEMLAPMAGNVRAARDAYEARCATAIANASAERLRLAELYEQVANWFVEQAQREPVHDHTGSHFLAITFSRRAAELRDRATRLRHGLGDADDAETCARAYRRLVATFDVSLEVFERKRFANLSHEPNKAMNLNAYLGLMGGTFRMLQSDGGCQLVPGQEDPDLVVEDACWVLTLDADSLLVHDYASRLVQQMRQPEMGRVAVIQTPYSAVPGAPGLLERTAGATTDIMHLVHQGMTAYDATYWVGANALLRKTALLDVATFTQEGDNLVARFIQDRTVIEDTESSIDLVTRGWSLFNYPERLAFSATPPDYGSLLVQRRRWANGGLIILPKLVRHLATRARPRHWLCALMRVHYLVSLACVNVALLVLTSVPFADTLASPLLPLLCLPYFALYARDLKLTGYRSRDIGHVYALNLLLTPVNLGGVLKSLQQGITGRRIPFGRTPKVAARTPAPALYVFATGALLLLWSTGAAFDVAASRWSHAILAGTNAAVLAYAVTRFMGWRHCVQDLLLPVQHRRVDVAVPAQHVAAPPHRRLLPASPTTKPGLGLLPDPRDN
ncbi:MAG TPA: glycosyltransferase family 2 protein [Nocardioidaceae bacterium]|nr:glycosyltransferase family 2 protein [Nocardioidaceae bacterium]